MNSLASLAANRLCDALLSRLDPALRGALDRLAPTTWTSPLGPRIVIDHVPDPPVLACWLQELLGDVRQPSVMAGRVPLAHLLPPAGRPIQVTRDLAGFWRGRYVEVRKALRGRYPKHPWPENPPTAQPWRPGLRREG